MDRAAAYAEHLAGLYHEHRDDFSALVASVAGEALVLRYRPSFKRCVLEAGADAGAPCTLKPEIHDLIRAWIAGGTLAIGKRHGVPHVRLRAVKRLAAASHPVDPRTKTQRKRDARRAQWDR